MPIIGNSNILRFEIRKVQLLKKGRSLTVTLPSRYVKSMDLHAGDLLKFWNDYKDKLFVEKVDLGSESKSKSGYYNQGGIIS